VGTRGVDGKHLAVGEWIASRPHVEASPEAFRWLAGLLRREGTDLLETTSSPLERGTPVFVDAAACVLEVQRLMASNHIRSLPVVDAGEVIGFVDLVELALTADLSD
jgi:CBS domain-containing protein